MIVVPKNHPLIEKLNTEGLCLTDQKPVGKSVKMLFLNLMPDKEDSEADLYRALQSVEVPIEITLIKMSNLMYKHTPQEYMNTYYLDLAELMEQNQDYDAMVINGAPFERFEYEEIVYWKQLCVFFRWADKHVKSTVHICWAAFARIYYNWGLHFKRNSFQWSGVYPHTIYDRSTSLVDNSLQEVSMPVSRPWYLSHDEVAAVSDMKIIAESPVTGPGIITAFEGRQIYTICHPEYGCDRLCNEYKRDLANGKNPMFPFNYFENDDESQPVKFSWQRNRDIFFKNWIMNYVLKL